MCVPAGQYTTHEHLTVVYLNFGCPKPPNSDILILPSHMWQESLLCISIALLRSKRSSAELPLRMGLIYAV